MPDELKPYFLFALERYDRPSQSTRTIGGLIIAMEDPVYVGRLLVGGETVSDHSDLVAPTLISQRLYEELQRLGAHPGSEVTRDYEELFNLITERVLRIERGTKVAFMRAARYTSFVRGTDRYEFILRQFLSEQVSRERG